MDSAERTRLRALLPMFADPLRVRRADFVGVLDALDAAERERDDARAQHATVLASLTHALAQGDALRAEAKDLHDRMTDAEVRATRADATLDSAGRQIANLYAERNAARAERDDARAEVETLRAEAALLRERLAAHARHTDAAVDGVRAMLPAALEIARREGRKEMRERAANVCERMIVGGCAWSEEQAAAAKVLFAAADNVRALPLDAPGGES